MLLYLKRSCVWQQFFFNVLKHNVMSDLRSFRILRSEVWPGRLRRLDCLTLEDGIDGLCRNVGEKVPFYAA
jgi:hypothetical protein